MGMGLPGILEEQSSSAWNLPGDMSWVSPLQTSERLSHGAGSLSVKHIIRGNASREGKVDTFSVWPIMTQLRGLAGSAFIIK